MPNSAARILRHCPKISNCGVRDANDSLPMTGLKIIAAVGTRQSLSHPWPGWRQNVSIITLERSDFNHTTGVFKYSMGRVFLTCPSFAFFFCGLQGVSSCLRLAGFGTRVRCPMQAVLCDPVQLLARCCAGFAVSPRSPIWFDGMKYVHFRDACPDTVRQLSRRTASSQSRNELTEQNRRGAFLSPSRSCWESRRFPAFGRETRGGSSWPQNASHRAWIGPLRGDPLNADYL